ncbi:hypothetical protein [Geobacter sp.]|uniref:hypothetical protein n=1 Tax=Geobacter sp. TaxID=46610 RepID=UPI0027BA4993|nr:hypothetical protein [Geobacter sp.]
MKQISDLLPKGVVAQTFAGGVVLIGTGLDTTTFREIMGRVPEKLKASVIGWRRVQVLPRCAA